METSFQKLNQYSEKKNQETFLKKLKKSSIDHEDDDHGLFYETTKILQTINDMRFIEKIARPIEKRIKQEYVEKFAGRMESLHTKLQKIKMQIVERSKNDAKANTKNRSVIGSVTSKPLNWKKSIREIQTRYNQIFIDGSFKFYPKLMDLNGFIYPLKTIKIEQWTHFCLNYNKSDQKGCGFCDCD